MHIGVNGVPPRLVLGPGAVGGGARLNQTGRGWLEQDVRLREAACRVERQRGIDARLRFILPLRDGSGAVAA